MSTNAKKQHYVWEYYLQAWATDRQIWCRRKDKDGIFVSSTENVAQQRYFYKINKPTREEITLIERILNRGDWLTRNTDLHTFRTYLQVAFSEEKIRRVGIKWHHENIEHKAFPIMSKLVAGDDAPLKSREDRINLAIFMGQQYTRTKKIRNSFIPPSKEQVSEKYKECDFQKVHEILSFIFANHIGAFIFEKLELRLIENTSSTNLITSDQPIYNILATPNLPAEDVKIYYPISPRFALTAEKTTNYKKISLDEDAAELNSFTTKNANEFIFSSRREDLV